jgi:hypothetical protein
LENISYDPIPVNDSFPNEQLAAIKVTSRESPWYADYANFIVSKYLSPTFTAQQRRKFFYGLRHYFWDDPHFVGTPAYHPGFPLCIQFTIPGRSS